MSILVCFVFVMFSAGVLYAEEGLYEKGMSAYLKKDYKTAVKYMKEYVAEKPDAKGYYLLGYANYELKRKTGLSRGRKDFWGDTETAKYFREAYLINPDFSPGAAIFKK
jgi:hypothetical protein